ncbi:MFS transporter [Prochlorococcus sp. MIT 1300]|uniref:MFS transporter n=1 Tax=Prochlorococcus sp. MIT 1300 TaxID=3096218 RepID=UPI002A757012|nr:MFS transporter [Prochlorococcus sp. MIT 1300]
MTQLKMRRFKAPVLLCAFITLLNDRLSETILLPLLPKLKQLFDFSATNLGLLAGTYALAQFAVAPLIGALSDRYGRKPIMTICVGGSVIGLGLFSLTVGLNWNSLLPDWKNLTSLLLGLLFLSRIIDGASGGTVASATAVLADISTPEKRAKAFGLIGVAFGLGFVIGPFLGGLLTEVNFTLPALTATAFALVNLFLVIFLLPETHLPSKRISIPSKAALNPITQLIRVFTNPIVRRLCTAFFLFFMAFNGLTSMLLLYLEEVFSWQGFLPGLSLAVVGLVAMIIQGLLIGPLVKNYGEYRLTLAGIGFVIIGCILLILANSENSIPMVFTALPLLAVGTGLVVPSLRSLVSRRLDDSGQGAVLGSLQGLQSLGTFLGAAAAGFSYEQIGPRSPFIIGIVVIITVGLLVAGGYPGSKKKSIVNLPNC